MKISRRSFLKAAATIGASLAWVEPTRGSRVRWCERRDLYPQEVASGDPDPHSVILWTWRPFAEGRRQNLSGRGLRRRALTKLTRVDSQRRRRYSKYSRSAAS
jgi:phosphodiesterase/alkaline phosphatase D-like protein